MNLFLKFARTRSARSAFLAAAAAAVAAVAVLATSPVWAAPASPVAGAPGSPPQRVEFLNGVSCPTSSFCMAVGYFEGLDFSPLSQIWNGSTWRTKAAPSRLPEGTLAAVSCPSSTSCLAVGRDFHTGVPIFDGWNGRTWRTLPPPTTPTVANLTSIACTGPASCIAVGTGRTAFSADGALAEQWNGTSWTRLATADPTGSSSSKFEGISCTSATSCMATGQFVTGTGNDGVGRALAESWNGSTWTQLPTSPSIVSFGAVSCGTASRCVTVGPVGPEDGPMASAVWNGSNWAPLTSPGPAGSFPEFHSVSCTSATVCIAVGATSTGPFAELWSGGTRWSRMRMQQPNTEPFDLTGVSCISRLSCEAVGGGLDDLPSLSTFTFAVRLSGSAWRVQRTGQFDALAAVSCARSTQCQAVGSFVTKLDNTQAMGQSWNGHAWRVTKPRGLPFELTDISCTSVTFCMAVGGHASATWNGRAWNSVRTHASGGAGFSQLSCRSRSFCLALGGTDGSEVWTGSLWRNVATVVPLHATTSGLTGLSCTRSTYCMAVGEFTLDQHGGVNHTLAEVWNGTRWRILHSPDPAPNSVFNAVSCVLGSGCMAVGNYVDAENAGHNLAARWNGASWRVLPMPGGNGFGSVGINGTTGPVAVSCPSAGRCMAVGSYFDAAANLGFNLALAWNGHAWRQTRTAGPSGGLVDVSCPSVGHCVATGQAGTLTLAERWNGKAWTRLKTPNP